jgi:hypothetical protein
MRRFTEETHMDIRRFALNEANKFFGPALNTTLTEVLEGANRIEKFIVEGIVEPAVKAAK